MILILLLKTSLVFITSNWYQLSPDEFFGLEEVSQPIEPANFDSELLEAAVFHATNQWRVKQNLPEFQFNDAIRKAAKKHAAYLFSRKKLSHINQKVKKFRTPLSRMVAYEKKVASAAENLAVNTFYILSTENSFYLNEQGRPVSGDGQLLKVHSYESMAHSLVQDWYGSPGHRKNMQGNYTWLGVGVSNLDKTSSLPQLFVVQNFAKP